MINSSFCKVGGNMSIRKSTGIVRNLDKVGRIVLPKELRKSFCIADGETDIDIWMENDEIILAPIPKQCKICKAEDDLHEINGSLLCRNCIQTIQKFHLP